MFNTLPTQIGDLEVRKASFVNLTYPPFLIPRNTYKSRRNVNQQGAQIKIVKGKPASNVIPTNPPDVQGIHSHHIQNIKHIPNQKTDNPSHMMLWEDVDRVAESVGQSHEQSIKTNTVKNKQISLTSIKNFNTFTVSDDSIGTKKPKLFTTSSKVQRPEALSTPAPVLSTRLIFPKAPLPHEYYTLRPSAPVPPGGGFIQNVRNILKNVTSFFQVQPRIPTPRPSTATLIRLNNMFKIQAPNLRINSDRRALKPPTVQRYMRKVTSRLTDNSKSSGMNTINLKDEQRECVD